MRPSTDMPRSLKANVGPYKFGHVHELLGRGPLDNL